MAKKQTTTAKAKAKRPPKSSATPVPQHQLRGLRLSKCTCARGEAKVSKLKQTINLKSSPKGDEPNAVNADVEFVICGHDPEGHEGVRIEATFFATFAVESLDRLAPEDVGRFLPLSALNSIWPYWRELVQSMTVRMGFPPLHLQFSPMISIKEAAVFKADRQTTSAEQSPVKVD